VRRRDLVTGLGIPAVLTPLDVFAQSATEKRVWRVGLLSNGPHQRTGWRRALLQVLGQAGLTPDKNLELIERYSEGNSERLPQLAREIGEADAIIAISQPAVLAAVAATKTSPIISVGSDPVANGLAKGYAHPGGRVTGISYQTTEGDPKRLELLSEAIPASHHFGYLGVAYQAATPLPQEMAQAAARLGIELTARWILGPGDYERAFREIRDAGAAGVVIGANQPLASDAERVVGNAVERRLPVICEWDYMARAGCFLSYGHNLERGERRVAEYVLRILNGTNPAELPIERSDEWKLTVNRLVAEQLGLIVPSAILARADEIIE